MLPSASMTESQLVRLLVTHQGLAPAPADCRTERLAADGGVLRVFVADRSWIVRRARHPRRELAAARLYAAADVPAFRVELLQGPWLCLEDLGLPALDTALAAMSADRQSDLFAQLGTVAMQAELVGMRDRNLRNVLVDAAADRLILVDYGGAFRAGLTDRVLRPHRYYAYLVGRLFFDVAARLRGTLAEPIATLFDAFCRGMDDEANRLCALGIPARLPLDGLTLRERLLVRTTACGRGAVRPLLARAADRAWRKFGNNDDALRLG